MRFDEIHEGLLQGKKYRLSYWNEDEYIYYDVENGYFKDKNKNTVPLVAADIMANYAWEEYVEPINYEKCIGCLCWFWDGFEENKSLSRLISYDSEVRTPFMNDKNFRFLNCKPAKPEEIKFYGGNNA